MRDSADGGIYDMIEYFGERQKIMYVHFRNVSSTVPKFQEEFINGGHVDMYRAMQTYKKVGYEGMFVDDHVPVVIGDSNWGQRAPRTPTHAPTASTFESIDATAIFVR